MSITLPQAFQKQMQASLPKSYEAFVSVLEQSEAPTSIRLNPHKKIESEQLSTFEKVPWAKQAYYLKERPSFVADPLWHAGAYYVQEASSMLLEQAILQHQEHLGEAPRVLDLCAAPGGKTTHLLSLLSKNAWLVANEVIQSRSKILAENVHKWGYPNVMVTNNDPKDFGNLEGQFDLIVIDAPCSGEGMFRKLPASIEHWSPDSVQHCAKRQTRILADIWDCLKPDGLLIYSTCTYNEAENEQQLSLLAEENDFESLRLDLDENWGVTEIQHEHGYTYKCYPHQVKGEGFCINILQKKEGRIGKLPKKIKKSAFKKAKGIEEEINKALINTTNRALLLWKEKEILSLPKEHLLWIEYVLQAMSKLRLVSLGLEIGNLLNSKKQLFSPSPQLAWNCLLNVNYFPTAELSWEDAMSFLRKEPIAAKMEVEAWNLVQYRGINLGWLKKIKQRSNNYYPKPYKLRLTKDKVFQKEWL